MTAASQTQGTPTRRRTNSDSTNAAHTRKREHVTLMHVREIHVRPQVRHHFGDNQLKDLCESIKEHGVLQPLLLRIVPGGYELIAGERRLRASKLAGLSHVPVTIREIPDDQVEDVQVVENLHRCELNDIEKTEALLRLYARQVARCTPSEAVRILRQLRRKRHDPKWSLILNETENFFRSKGSNWESFASSNLVNLGYPDDVKDLVRHHGLEISKAKILVRLKDQGLRELVGRQAVEQNLSVRELERQIDAHLNRPVRARPQVNLNLDDLAPLIARLPNTRRRAAESHYEALRTLLR